MIIDLSQASDDHLSHVDVCIVGSGAAGITLAREFADSALKVVVLESGGLSPDSETTDLYQGNMAPGGKYHCGVHEGRARVFGGTTTLWGGQARVLSPIDFEKRDWVEGSGWPFSASTLDPYRERAGAVMGLRDVNFEEDLHAAFGIRRTAFDPKVVEHIYSRWSPQPNFATAYSKILTASQNITVLKRANVTQILLSADGTRVKGLEVKSLGVEGVRLARAKFYIVCCGGIETPRLLLASNRQHPAGVGNQSDLVGRYFQDHLSIRWADFIPTDRKQIDNLFNSFFRGRTKYYPLLTASDEFQRRNRTLNISAAVVMDNPAESTIEVLKTVFRAMKNRNWTALSNVEVRKILKSSPAALFLAYRMLIKHRSYANPQMPLYLGSTLEQEPNFHSRVRLDSHQDSLGMPRVLLDWRLTPLLGHTLVAFAKELQVEIERAGLGQVNLHPWLLSEPNAVLERMKDVYHHMGTTRMHESEREGVVDPDCKVHGLDNLFIGSSSVFPTGGHSNPTFTLLQLCFRLADRIKLLLNAS